MNKRLFGQTKNGEEIFLFSLENENGVKAEVMNYGAILVNLFVPDKNGDVQDIVLGYDTLEEYIKGGSFFGATVAPNGNRIAKAQFSLNGNTYNLSVNDGRNNLHSDVVNGAHKRVWDYETGDNFVKFTLEFQDGELGFPGNRMFEVIYQLTDDNELKISYTTKSDKDTVVNPTNHSFFNLGGHNSNIIEDHIMQINSMFYTDTDEELIPTGEILKLEGTPLDFSTPHVVGERIEDDFTPLKLAGGYDHNYVIEGYNGSIRKAAEVLDEKSGRKMEVYTDLPGLQFYSGNFISNEKGKNGSVYLKRQGLCLETQFYPNAVNITHFPSAICKAGETVKSNTVYKFIF